MKKLILFLIMFPSLTAGLFAQTPQYFNFDTSGQSNYYPFDTQGGKQAQWLIRPGEFNRPSSIPSGKNITALYFFMASTSTKRFWHLNICLGQTALTSLPIGDVYREPLTTVYYRTIDTLGSTAGSWMRIKLDAPFPYDTSLSLVIEVSQSASILISGGSMMLKQTTMSGIRRCANNFSSSNYCDFTYSYQDNNVVNCGVDVDSTSTCAYYWINQNSGTTNTLRSVKTVSNLIGWTAGAGGTILRTTNGGTTWINGNPNPGIIEGEIYSIEAMNADTAFCTSKSTSAAFVNRTTNGGTNWAQVFAFTGGFINAIHFTSPRYGYAVSSPIGGNWIVWISTDCGASWGVTRTIPQNGNESGWNNSMFFTGNYAWFGTNNSRVYKAYNPVCNWLYASTAGLVNSMSIHFNSNSLGLAGGNTLVRTIDGGLTWLNLNAVPGNGNILGIDGNGTDFWFIRGTEIYRSSNSGGNWNLCFTASDSLFDIDFAITNGCPGGWIVGRSGTIVKMNSDSLIGIGNYNNRIPNSFKLYQNYPNPFNPATKIKFEIPASPLSPPFGKGGRTQSGGFVRLIIYDALGKEITTLVNQQLKPGTYEVELEGSSYPSGVYFYRLEAGEYTETKKMVLLK
jgi:Secretion system C-terminal sorting domain